MGIYDHNDDDSDNNPKRSKLISFSINNRSGHFEQLTKAVMMIQSVFDDAEIGNVLRC